MDTYLTTFFAAGITILLTFIYYWTKNRGILPGPVGVPYLGLYPYLTDENVHLKLAEYKKKYGDIFSFTYTGRLFINLGSIKAVREIFLNKSDCFMEKYSDTNIMTEILRNGLVFVNGEHWKVLRKFFILKFKEYVLSTLRGDIAGPVYDSLNVTIEDMKNLDGKPINTMEFLGQRCAATIRKIIFGEKDITDEIIGKMVVGYTESLEGNEGINLLLIGPLARLLFAVKSTFQRNLKAHKTMVKLVLDSARKLERTMYEENPTCIIEEFFKERNTRRRENDPTWKYFSDMALAESILQFIGDGVLGVTAFIAGIFNYLVEYPEEQDKIYSELMDVIGPNRQPSAEDRTNLPYTNAFVTEYIRHNNLFYFFPSLECTKETSIRGHRIPVGSITLLNFYSAHRDPDTFEDPDTFNPSRYIATSDKPKAESPVSFGVGKRSCSGEAFVMLQVFLYFTTIVKNFKIVASNASANISGASVVAGTLELTFTARTENE